jgi:elongation factor Ts
MVQVGQIKKLRDETGAGIADCREALEKAKGDEKKAIEIIKEKGFEKAAKKGDRATSSGLVFSYVHGGKIGVLVAMACETDFVAKTDDFLNLGKEIALQIASMNPKNVKELLAQDYIRDPKVTIDAMIKMLIGKLGENIKVDGFNRLTI